MFNKYRNIKKIGLVLIGLALVIFFNNQCKNPFC